MRIRHVFNSPWGSQKQNITNIRNEIEKEEVMTRWLDQSLPGSGKEGGGIIRGENNQKLEFQIITEL